ncbi:MAG: Beta-fructosidase [Candidatus Moanabacter tarae]|uniref:beta-fructofuranosidase n=1 Tax=Candidatus Moanibacter tarae TaxID=2200854 RepID=A0A2Z4AE67_9BACT|nr:MAG: Beta-fructosidase [Candidatus Moanabacter tarae]|tara:strand:- start:74479 stop:76035 length:1557 start_codon:yes stop_codon:yes gene_type:complete
MKYQSKLPQRTYATTLEEQLEELETDELMLRYGASRQRLSSDRYRPVYHYVNPEGPTNDPNGFCVWQGRYHLFYQQYPPEDKRQHWGHAVSEDLVYWKDLPTAIYPGIEDRCYSGSALTEDDRVLACYHGTKAGIMIAESSDPLLLNWEKIPGCPVIPEKEAATAGDGDPYKFAGSCLWKGKKGYYSVTGSCSGERYVDAAPTPHLFFSDDLRNWTYRGLFMEGDIFTTAGEDCAVPYFWPFGDKHILIFCSHQQGSQSLLGNWDEEEGVFRPFAHDRFCFGAVNNGATTAPTAIPDGNGGILVIHVLNHGLNTDGWNGMMSLPTRLSMGPPGNAILYEPVTALEKLRADHQHIDETALPANTDITLEGIAGNSMEIIARIDPKESREVCLEVLRSPEGEETTSIRYLQNGGPIKGSPGTWYDAIVIDTCRASLHPQVLARPPEKANFKLEDEEMLELRIFVDTSIIEVFANNRRYMAVRVYPYRDDSLGVRMRSQGSDSVLLSLDAWRMKSIWKKEL